MKRNTASFKLTNTLHFKQKMLGWANRFNIFCLLDSCDYNLPYKQYDCILGAGALQIFAPQEDKLKALKQFTNTTTDWLFGHISYDFKNEIENVSSNNFDATCFNDITFFQPETVIEINGDEVIISTIKQPGILFTEIDEFVFINESVHQPIKITARISKENYINKVQQIQQHILLGDCYEINFCQEFYAENVFVNPIDLYTKLNTASPNPFSALYKLNNNYCICASPERYIKKHEATIISQPIKGTLKREEKNYISKDEQQQLFNSLKDRTENVMIVDLVRNDLNKICKPATVQPTALYGIQTFPQVHQMVSTITGELSNNIDFADIIKATFPMGSMTGAPKKKVMELIEHYEETKRGIYSGCIGYIKPNKDFDFNVVIRSLIYNSLTNYLNYHVGGAITFNSNALDEYEECLLKAEAIMNILQ